MGLRLERRPYRGVHYWGSLVSSKSRRFRTGVVYEAGTGRAENLSDAAAGWVYCRILSHRRRHRTIGSIYETVFGGSILSRGPPAYIQFANTWLILNVGGGPTPYKPSVTLSVPADPDSVSSFMNIRVSSCIGAARDPVSLGVPKQTASPSSLRRAGAAFLGSLLARETSLQYRQNIPVRLTREFSAFIYLT
jgi:hypothetical protein